MGQLLSIEPRLKARRRSRNPFVIAWRVARQDATASGCGFLLCYVEVLGMILLMRFLLAVTGDAKMSKWWRETEASYGDD